MLTIRCSKCRRKIFKYEKVGKGRLLHCWRNRIIEDHSVREGMEVRCVCGNLVGIDERKWIRLKQRAITYSGAVTRR